MMNFFAIISLYIIFAIAAYMPLLSCGSPISEGAFALPPVCGLACWLKNMNFTLPDINERLFDIKSFTCRDLEIDSIASNFSKPSSFHLELANIGASCSFVAHVKVFDQSETVKLTLRNTSASFTMKLVEGSDHLVKSVSLTEKKLDIKGTFESSSSVLNLIWDILKNTIINYLDSFVCEKLESVIATKLNPEISKVNDFIRHPQQQSPPPVPNGSMRLNQWPIMTTLAYVADTVIGVNGTLGIKKIFNALTNNTGMFHIDETIIRKLPHGGVFRIPIPGTGLIKISMKDAWLEGLNSWNKFSLFLPHGDYMVTSASSSDYLNINATLSIDVGLDAHGPVHSSVLHEDLIFSMDLHNCDMNNTLLLAISEKVIENIYDKVNKNDALEPSCIAYAFDEVNFTDFSLKTNLKSLKLQAMNSLEMQIDTMLNNIVLLFTSNYQVAIPAAIFSLAAGPVRELIDVSLSNVIANMSEPCGPAKRRGQDPNLMDMDVPATIGGMALAVALSIMLLIFMGFTRRFRRKNIDSISSEVNTSQPLLRDGSALTVRKGTGTAEAAALGIHWWQASLLFTDMLNRYIRVAFPVVCFFTFGLYISSSTSVGASVFATIKVNETSILLPSLFDFSLASSVHDMWKAGVYPLSLLIVILSGAWPYLKLLLILFCWVAPVCIFSVQRREKMLRILDALGKWSLIDAYVLILMSVAFHFIIMSPPSLGMPEGSLTAEVTVEPQWGFYLFLICTILALILSHISVAFHRYAEDVNTTKYLKYLKGDRVHNLSHHAFRYGDHTLVQFTYFGRALVASMLAGTIAIIIVGSSIDTFSFNFEGAVELVFTYLDMPTRIPYSLISIGESISSESGEVTFGLVFIQILYFILTIAVPLAHLIMLMVLWLLPLSATRQRKIYVATEVLNAWSALDVFVLSIFVAILELHQLASFLVGDKCNFINPLLKKYFSEVIVGEPTCFSVVARLEPGFWFLFTAVIVYVTAGWTVMELCHKVIEERAATAMKRVLKNEDLSRMRDVCQTDTVSSSSTCSNDEVALKPGRCMPLKRFFAITAVKLRIVNIYDDAGLLEPLINGNGPESNRRYSIVCPSDSEDSDELIAGARRVSISSY